MLDIALQRARARQPHADARKQLRELRRARAAFKPRMHRFVAHQRHANIGKVVEHAQLIQRLAGQVLRLINQDQALAACHAPGKAARKLLGGHAARRHANRLRQIFQHRARGGHGGLSRDQPHIGVALCVCAARAGFAHTRAARNHHEFRHELGMFQRGQNGLCGRCRQEARRFRRQRAGAIRGLLAIQPLACFFTNRPQPAAIGIAHPAAEGAVGNTHLARHISHRQAAFFHGTANALAQRIHVVNVNNLVAHNHSLVWG